MTGNNEPSFNVLLAESTEAPAVKVAEALAAFHNIPFQDGAHVARVAWGFLGLGLTEPEAKRLAGIVESKGIHARILDSHSVGSLPKVQQVKTMTFEPAGITFGFTSGESELVAAPRIKAIAAIAVPMRAVTTEKITEGPTNVDKLVSRGLWLAGIPNWVGKRKRVVDKTTVKEDIFFYLDLLCTQPAHRYRIDAQSLSYSFLKERMLHNTLVNFKLLLSDLVRLCPSAYQNRGTRFLVNNLLIGQMGYESLADLDKELLWLSAI